MSQSSLASVSWATWVAHTLVFVYARFHHVMLTAPMWRWIGCREHMAPDIARRGLGDIHISLCMRHPRIMIKSDIVKSLVLISLIITLHVKYR